MHSPRDEIVDIDHARRLYEALRHPKSFLSLDDASHLLTDRRDAEYAGEVLAAWVSRYLPEEALAREDR
jgi:putative redox protein